MCSMKVVIRWCALVLIGGALCGCLPSSQGPLDEQKEMHFLTGKARQTQLDYQGAIEAFNKALQANPQNASAHFELGLIYENERIADYSAAIYHFERFLKLRPNSDYAQVVKERIVADKIELSKTTVLPPVTQSMQRDFEKLAEENKQLRAELEKTQAEAEQWRSYYARASQGQPVPSPGSTLGQSPSPTPSPASYSSSATRPALRTHIVKSGDTLSSIARLYSVKLDTIRAVNPGVDPRKMRVGDKVNVPMN